MAASHTEFNAYAIQVKSGPAAPWKYTPRPLGEHDVEMKVTHCGVCHSDIHILDSAWPNPTTYPLVPGHEVVGIVVAKGAHVTKFAVGDRVGLGPQCYACFKNDCVECSSGQDCCCPRAVYTYDDKYPDGGRTYGGYSEALRTHDSLLAKIPAALPSDAVAPLLCAGITVWSPLIDHHVGPGKKIGIVGMGGLGHLAVQYAAKLGADVTVISHSHKKEADAKLFGAHHFMVASPEEFKKHSRHFDFIMVASSGNGTDWNALVTMLKACGKLLLVGLAEEEVHVFPGSLTAKKITIVGSILAPLKQIEEMLEFSAKHHIVATIEKLPMSQVNEAIARVRKGDVRYRIVLENPTH